MPTERSNELKLAVLIDADNIPYANVKGMMEEIAKYGTPTFKRIYGDWTRPTTTGWKGVLLQNAITPIQQYSYTSGKNATDSAMIIDAMDILYTGRVDGFCIVSSDSDFTRLATRLREAGMKVIGIGEKKTPEPFITACDKFIYLEILSTEDTAPDLRARRPKKESLQKMDKRVLNLIKSSINDVADESGWAFLGEVGTLILKKQPNFDARNYGFRKLLQLMKSIEDIEVDERLSESGGTRHVYVKVK
ncbi:MAG TPA: NYN domain-containing protein [Chryseosolibacter sp.]|nr:NYN domain-containing protein [Chryseosolibacter sp.]